jgi:hypothetical protein
MTPFDVVAVLYIGLLVGFLVGANTAYEANGWRLR